MTVLEYLQSQNIDELAEWFNRFDCHDSTPWVLWWDRNYCKKCKPEIIQMPSFDGEREAECGWCELNHKCIFFQDKDDIPDNEEIIKMWLNSVAEI